MKKENNGLNILICRRMVNNGPLICIIALFLSIFVFHSCRKNDKKVVLQREWTANAEFAGDVWASKISKEYGIELEVREGAEASDPVKQVRVGDADFGVASADRILEENENGAELVVLASATCKSPVIFLSRKGSGIRTPQDFRGKTIGIQSGTNTELVFHALISKVGLSDKDMRIVEPGWGINSFVTGDIDVLSAFDYDEPIQLDIKNIAYERPIFPEEYDIKYVGTVFFTRKELINERHGLVQSFMNCLVKGWDNAIKNPKLALDLLFSYSSRLDKDKEQKSFEKGIEYFKGEEGRLLYSSIERWEKMLESLKALKKINNDFTINGNIDYSFLENALTLIRK